MRMDRSSASLARGEHTSLVRENQRSIHSALDPKGLPQSEHYGKRSGARPTEERSTRDVIE